MPKASSTPSSTRPSGAPFQSAQVLRRNQACHQCRRRKLKCDAKRPACSTCVRSHSYAVSHAPPDAELPPRPECTFDETSEPTVGEDGDSPQNRFERLENRISELEAMLQEKERDDESRSRSVSEDAFQKTSALVMRFPDGMNAPSMTLPVDGQVAADHQLPGGTLGELAGVAGTLAGESSPNGFRHSAQSGSPQSDLGSIDMMYPGWPRALPSYPYLRHLVEAFFAYTPGVSRMFHAPTFLASISLPVTHPKFPQPAILHAMCALGSMYIPDSTSASSTLSSTYVPGADPWSASAANVFAEQQIKAAKGAIEGALRTAEDLFASLQAQIIIASWFWYNARWSEACVSFALSLRYAVPCGLNACPPFESNSSSNMMHASVIPQAANVIEDEVRRNTFWIAYMMERHFAAMNNFAMMLDDEDIAQMLPVRGDQFEQGILVHPELRQWSHEPNVIEKHPDDQVDSFILHVKATMLLSKVKVFNCRYKARRHLGDPAMQPDPAGIPGMPGNDLIQSTPAFIELDRLIVAYKQSLPAHLKDPLANGAVDVSLLTAVSIANLAMILLHESHARIGRAACISSCKVLNSARAILNLLHEAYSASHNLALMGVFPMICWFTAGRVLIRYLRAAIDAQSDEHIVTLQTEVDFIRSVIGTMGESVPHAQHYAKMLNDTLAETCGKEYVTVVSPPPLAHRETHAALHSTEYGFHSFHDMDLNGAIASSIAV